jgi:hypothetical protein
VAHPECNTWHLAKGFKRSWEWITPEFSVFEGQTFILNLGNDADDAGDILQLKGKYRLVKGSLFLPLLPGW